MAEVADTVKQLHDYFNGVIARAGHHAQNVDEVIYPLLGLIVSKADEGTITIRTYKGAPANVLCADINNKKYTFTYDHSKGEIKILEGNLNGILKASVSNGNDVANLKNIFAGL